MLLFLIPALTHICMRNISVYLHYFIPLCLVLTRLPVLMYLCVHTLRSFISKKIKPDIWDHWLTTNIFIDNYNFLKDTNNIPFITISPSARDEHITIRLEQCYNVCKFIVIQITTTDQSCTLYGFGLTISKKGQISVL